MTLQSDNKYGLADSLGATIYPVDNDAVYNQEVYRYYTVQKGNLYGIYFINGRQKTLEGLYDKTGKIVIPVDCSLIIDSDTGNSNILILRKQDRT